MTTNSLQKIEPKSAGLQEFNRTIVNNSRTQEYLTSVLGEKRQSFVNNLTALVANNAMLQECQPLTLMYAAIKATALDLPLDPNLGCAYVIPYRNNKKGVTEAQFQIGYKGFIQLAIRSGQFQCLNTTEVREGELGGVDLLTGEVSLRAVVGRESKPVIGYAAYFRLTNGFSKMLYMTKGEVEAHAGRYSQTYKSRNSYIKQSSLWSTDFDAMAKKTVLKLLLNRYAPLSVEMRDAVESDQGVFRDKELQPTYVDNEKQTSLADIALAQVAEGNEHVESADALENSQVVESVDEATGEVLPAESATEESNNETNNETRSDGSLFE